MRSHEIQLRHITEKERLEISLFRLNNGVSLGPKCCFFFARGQGLDVTEAMVP